MLLLVLIFSACSLKYEEETQVNPKFAYIQEGENKPSGENNSEAPPEETITVPVSTLKKNLSESSSMWEFAQRLMDDVIIYKNIVGEFCYEPINKELPLSNYDFDKLVNVKPLKKEFEYQEDGKTISLKGIDVSRYQGENIDWKKVAEDGVVFTFIRLGYRGYKNGTLVLDEQFNYNIENAIQNGIAVGIYFVTQAVNMEEVQEEVNFVLENIKDYKVTWPIVLDLEDAASNESRTRTLGATARTDFVIEFCNQIKEKGYTPMLYSNIRWFIEELELERLTAYDKWFAQYFNRPFFPYEFQIWQYTNTGSVKGIKGNVDLNISFVNYGEKNETTSL